MDGKKQEMKLFKTNYFSKAKLLKEESRMLKKLQVKEKNPSKELPKNHKEGKSRKVL